MTSSTPTEEVVLSLARGVRLRHDKVRNRHILLAPERTIVLDAISPAIIRLLDGKRTMGNVVDCLSQTYQAPRDVIATDTAELVAQFLDRRLLEAG